MSSFWRDRRVLVTGHTGFKGSWLTLWLHHLGARVSGLALAPDTNPSLFEQLGLEVDIDHRLGDIREANTVTQRLRETEPQVILHLAAQPLVRRSYAMPRETWATNVMGTVHLLDALRGWKAACAVVVVTTDKVYQNREWVDAYRETDRLGGHDPYSASKAACELVVQSYRKSFFEGGPVRVATARAGNVIGGGDWAEDRIMPDLMRALAAGTSLGLRNPASIRPWQHVLDPLRGYLLLAERLSQAAPEAEDAFNFGPDAADQRSVQELVEASLAHWKGAWHCARELHASHEAGRLSLATEKARATLNWAPRWGFDEAVRNTVEWYRMVHDGAAPRTVSMSQIEAFEKSVGR